MNSVKVSLGIGLVGLWFLAITYYWLTYLGVKA
jgi:hypothetical protein